MRRFILAGALALAALFVVAPAQAGQTVCTSGCGYVTYTEYQNISTGELQATVQSDCGCQPTYVEYQYNGTYKVAIYNANNSTFAWDIRQIQIGYYVGSDGHWHVDYKGRIGCPEASCGTDSPALMIP